MGSVYLGVCVRATGVWRVTDAGLKAFSAAVEASTTITTVTLMCTCARCEYLLELEDGITLSWCLCVRHRPRSSHGCWSGGLFSRRGGKHDHHNSDSDSYVCLLRVFTVVGGWDRFILVFMCASQASSKSRMLAWRPFQPPWRQARPSQQ